MKSLVDLLLSRTPSGLKSIVAPSASVRITLTREFIQEAADQGSSTAHRRTAAALLQASGYYSLERFFNELTDVELQHLDHCIMALADCDGPSDGSVELAILVHLLCAGSGVQVDTPEELQPLVDNFLSYVAFEATMKSRLSRKRMMLQRKKYSIEKPMASPQEVFRAG